MTVGKKSSDLFEPVVPLGERHKAFESLRASTVHEPTRRFINETAERMGDPDGNLVLEFQTQGFHARLFELACFSFLEAQGLVPDRTLVRPDFIVSRDGRTVAALEAVTAHASEGQWTDISLLALRAERPESVAAKSRDDFPIRIGRALTQKLKKAYWSLPQCAALPLVLVVGPFHEPGSGTYIDEALARYLYAVDRIAERSDAGWIRRELPVSEHHFAGRSIRSGFFHYPRAEHVSAVIFANQWTVSRFDRLARDRDGWSPKMLGIRQGPCLLPDDEFEVCHFKHLLGDPATPLETWWQGVTLFHNPRALYPLPEDAIRCTSAFRVRDGLLCRDVHDFHPLTSFMEVRLAADS